jgi:hypothetical protein
MKGTPDDKPDRISFATIGEAILQQLNLEKGLGFTIRELALHPGRAIKEYLYENRGKYTKPLTLLLLMVAAATFLSLKILPIDDSLVDSIENDPTLNFFPEKLRGTLKQLPIFLKKYFNLAFMSSIPAVALSTYFLFKEKGFNLAEHFIINIYIFSIQTIFFIIFMPLLNYWSWTVGLHIAALAFYTIYAYKQVFDQTWLQSLAKSIMIYLMSQFFISVVLTIVLLIMLLF